MHVKARARVLARSVSVLTGWPSLGLVKGGVGGIIAAVVLVVVLACVLNVQRNLLVNSIEPDDAQHTA